MRFHDPPIPDSHLLACEKSLVPAWGTLCFRSVIPPNRAIARLAIIHGYGDHSGRYFEFMRWIASRGVACHSFDFRGHGRSTGRRGFVHAWSDHLDDLTFFLRQPEFEPSPDQPLFLLGHSHGALVLAAAAIRNLLPSHVAGVILTSPYFRNRVPVPRYKLLLNRIANRYLPWLPIKTGIRVEWLSSDAEMCRDRRCDPLALRRATPRWFSTMQEAQREVMAHAAGFRLPLLMLVAGADPIADTRAMEELFAACGSTPKTLHIHPRMVHEILRETGRELAFKQVLDWMAVTSRPDSTRTPQTSADAAPSA